MYAYSMLLVVSLSMGSNSEPYQTRTGRSTHKAIRYLVNGCIGSMEHLRGFQEQGPKTPTTKRWMSLERKPPTGKT